MPGLGEKILAEHVIGDIASVGDVMTVSTDLMICDDHATARAIMLFREMGGDIPLHKDKIIITCEHFTPPASLDSAELQHEVRLCAHKWGIDSYYELGRSGIGPLVALSENLVKPGMFVAGTNPAVYALGGIGCYATVIGAGDMAALWRKGKIHLLVPRTIFVKITGIKPPHIDGADIALTVLKNFRDIDDFHSFEFHGDGLSPLGMDDRLELSYYAAHSGASTAIIEPSPDILKTLGYQQHGNPPKHHSDGIDYEIELNLNDTRSMVAMPPSAEKIATVDEAASIEIDLVIIGGGLGGTLGNLRKIDKIIGNRKLDKNIRMFVYPASSEIMLRAIKEGIIERFIAAGILVCAPGHGTEGFGHRGSVTGDETVLINGSLFHEGRLGHVESTVYLASTQTCAASALAGKIIPPGEIA